MILILSLEEDFSTNEVVEWLLHFKIPFVRINWEDKIIIEKIILSENTEFEFSVNGGRLINSKEITAFWYRRGDIKMQGRERFSIKKLEHLLQETLFDEMEVIKDMIYFFLEKNILCIGSFHKRSNNKLIHLMEAKKVGWDIPDTIIGTNYLDFVSFFKKHPSGIIVKPLSRCIFYNEEHLIPDKTEKYFSQFVAELKNDDFKNIAEKYFPSLFQEKINKKFEIRVFFLLGECYSMAIFSQNDDETKVDFRRYNLEKQNYRVPYNLPKNIKKKINTFMKNQGLNTGSLDIILSDEMKYYFLEVNPVGQFGMVSYPCNFNLEKRIAEKLTTIN